MQLNCRFAVVSKTNRKNEWSRPRFTENFQRTLVKVEVSSLQKPETSLRSLPSVRDFRYSSS